MTRVTAVELSEIDFSPFGTVVRLAAGGPDVVTSTGDGWSGVFSAAPLMAGSGSLGYTTGVPAPCTFTTMEQHHHTKEALFAQAGPVVLAVADTPGPAPAAQDVVAVVIRPGDLVILDEGVWHDACHGLGVATPYYWFAVCDPQITDPWVPVEGGPVHLDGPAS